MKCSTGKRSYSNEDLAEEALIQARIRFEHSKVVGVYQCQECGEWHLTSVGEVNSRLKKAMEDGSLKHEIDRYQWGQKYRH